MSEAEKHAAAMSDPDARPLTEEDMNRMKRTPRSKIIRRALGLRQEEFAARQAAQRAMGFAQRAMGFAPLNPSYKLLQTTN